MAGLRRRRATITTVGLVALVFALVVAGCSGGSSEPDSSEGEGAGLTPSRDERVAPTPSPALALIPDAVTLLEAGNQTFTVTDEIERGEQWSFAVDGIEGGNDRVGRIVPVPDSEDSAVYVAPATDETLEITVTATDRNDPSRIARAAVTVVPVAASDIVIRPAIATVPLRGNFLFEAGLELPGGGFTVIDSGFWSVNGERPGTALAGVVNEVGLYAAPLALPDQLPAGVEVGFSLSRDGPTVATTQVILASLTVTPSSFSSAERGDVGRMSAVLRLSDGTVVDPVPFGDLTVTSSPDGLVRIDPNGVVTDIATTETGRAVIKVLHDETGAVDVSLAFVRSGLDLTAEVEVRTGDLSRMERASDGPDGAVTEIEFSRPGAIFNFVPLLTFLRGPNAGDKATASQSEFVIITAGASARAYDLEAGDRPPDLTNLVASVETQTGLVTIGDKPGVAVLTATYDDGLVRHRVDLNVVFSRVQLEVTAESSVPINNSLVGILSEHDAPFYGGPRSVAMSGEPSTVTIEDTIVVTVKVAPAAGRIFTGRTPVQVTLTGPSGQSEVIRVGLRTDQEMNTASLRDIRPDGGFQFLDALSNAPFLNQEVETTDLLLIVGSANATYWRPDTDSFWSPADQDERDENTALFRIMPTRSGPHTFRLSVPNDPGVTPVEFTLNVELPRIPVITFGSVDTSFGAPVPLQDLIVVQNAWQEEIFPGDVDPHNPSFWTWTSPDGSVVEVPAEVTLPVISERLGTHRLHLGRVNDPEIRTDDVTIEVVGPASIAGFAMVEDEERQVLQRLPEPAVPRRGLFGSFQILSPLGGPWVEGVGLPITIQTYDAGGQPRSIGLTVRDQATFFDGTTGVAVHHKVWGVRVQQCTGDSDFRIAESSGPLYPEDGSGLIRFTVIPTAAPGIPLKDFCVDIGPRLYEPEEMVGLPVVEIDRTNDTATGAADLLGPVSATSFAARPRTLLAVATPLTAAGAPLARYPQGRSPFLHQKLFLPGVDGGLAVEPAVIPVASARVREAVAAGKLPAGADEVLFVVHGSEAFARSLAAGIGSIDLGAGMAVVETITNEDGRSVTIRAKTILSAFAPIDIGVLGFKDSPLYGDREITLTLGDGTEWHAKITLFGLDLVPVADTRLDSFNPVNVLRPFDRRVLSDKNIPLNGRVRSESGTAPKASLRIAIQPRSIDDGQPLWDMQLELVPSVDFGTTNFRGVPGQPTIGFERSEVIGGTGDREMIGIPLETRRRVLHTLNGVGPGAGWVEGWTVFGNITDRRRLDPTTGELGPTGDPDGLPDFVSTGIDAEKLIATANGNIVDVLLFTAYNLIAEVAEDLDDPGLDFDSLKADIGSTYFRYGGGVPSSATTEDVVAALSSINVQVDHEATGILDRNAEENLLSGRVPKNYWAGVLDQYYLSELESGGFGTLTTVQTLGQDGRVHAFDGEGRDDPFRDDRSTVPREKRRGFGIELDGVLYDPGIVSFDADPNDGQLLTLPVLESTSIGLIENGLLKDLGGTSGGYYDLDRETPGSTFVLSKTPAQDLPGVHGGYLINGKPSDLKDPFFGGIEDDINDVVIRRADPGEGETLAGSPILSKTFGGVIATELPGRVNAFGTDEDKKGPITTGITAAFSYAIVTDPAGVGPIKFRSVLIVKEIPVEPEDRLSLLVTTQSSGSEGKTKALLDTVVDVSVDVLAAVALNTLTSGGVAITCGGPGAPDAFFALMNGIVNIVDTAPTTGGSRFGEALSFANNALQSGTAVFSSNLVFRPSLNAAAFIPSGGDDLDLFKPEAFGNPTRMELRDRLKKALSAEKFVAQAKKVPFCALLKAPFSAFKSAVKNSFSVEDLGGNGAAEAFAMKTVSLSIPPEAQTSRVSPSITYIAQVVVSRRIDILPGEPFPVKASEALRLFNDDPATLSDIDWLRKLITAAEGSDEAAELARSLLKRITTFSVERESDYGIYEDYTLRFRSMPSLALGVFPGQRLGVDDVDGRMIFGDFELTTGRSVIPVKVGSVVAAARTNQNAGARAAVKSNGYELLIVDAVISPPSSD